MKQKFLTFILLSFSYALAFGQNIEAGTYPGLCPGGTPITLTGTVLSLPPGADDYCTQWVEPNGNTTDGMEITVSPTMTTSYTFEVTFSNGDIQTDVATITVCEMEIHPVDDDFVAGNVGKLMIWTGPADTKYYTDDITTKANKAAQSEDGFVHVTVHLKPAAAFVGRTVNFKFTNPDLDDQSPYETTVGGVDNRDMAIGTGQFDDGSVYKSDITTSVTIDGETVAAAEVKVKITNRYSGDNYQVEASLDPFFTNPAETLKTSEMVAWKRIYVEEDNMLKKGATLTAANTLDADMADDVLNVDNASDFTVGDMIQIFDKAGGFANKTVKAKTATTITVEDMGAVFVKYSGVRINGQTATYSISNGLFTAGFGGDVPGTDGGAFVEFEWGFAGSQSTPKYTEFPADMWVTAIEYGEYWFNNSGGGNNIFQMVAAADDASGAYGVSQDSKNVSLAFVQNFAFGANNAAAIGETMVHEFGHLFGVSNAHVDASTGTNNHDGSDKCNMSYDRVRDNSIVEFDTDCLYDIRDAVVPR